MIIYNSKSGTLVLDLINRIQDNRQFLSEIDGKIGDGDHGINMSKGFSMCGEKLEGKPFSLSDGFFTLGKTLMDDIGGSMGPLYGVFFEGMAYAIKDIEEIDAYAFEKMLDSATVEVQEIGSAKKGDKTLLDVLIPANTCYSESLLEGKDFKEALEDMKKASEKGWLSTKEMTAKVGRASRLGERSRGVLDAGATSCNIIIRTIGNFIQNEL